MVCVCSPKGVTVCVKVLKRVQFPPTSADTCIIFLPSKYGWISHNRPSNLLLHIHFLSLFSPSLSHPLCNYKVAEAVSPVSQRLAAWHWEWRRKRFPLSSVYVPSFSWLVGPTAALSKMVAVHPCQHLSCILSCPSLCRWSRWLDSVSEVINERPSGFGTAYQSCH